MLLGPDLEVAVLAIERIDMFPRIARADTVPDLSMAKHSH